MSVEVVTHGRRHEVRCSHPYCAPAGRSVLVLFCRRWSEALQIAQGHRRAHELDDAAAVRRDAGARAAALTRAAPVPGLGGDLGSAGALRPAEGFGG